MTRQIIFGIALLLTIGIFSFTINRVIKYFRFTRPAFPIKDIVKRINVMITVAFGQTKIFRRPVIGMFHAFVFWGFCIIIFGSIEMVIDGLTGTVRVLKFLGPVYNIIMASGDIFALLVAISIVIFLSRRLFFHIKRFEGIEMKKSTHIDANIALSIILLLMVSLLAMNTGYLEFKSLAGETSVGVFPVSKVFAGYITGGRAENYKTMYEASWWTHILLIFLFANILPYSCLLYTSPSPRDRTR